MNKTAFIAELAKRTGRSVTEMYKFTNEFLTLTTEVLTREEDVLFVGFGRFLPRKQNARLVRNPKTGTPAMFYGRTTVSFKPGKDLLKTINRK